MKHYITFSIALLALCLSHAQSKQPTTWHDLSEMKVYGKLQDKNTAAFTRFPSTMEKKVRKNVWNLSKHSAGLYVKFQTDAAEIVVRYVIDGDIAMPHMPATGVSGVDLYSKGESEKWNWLQGRWSYKDTISYKFPQIKPSDTKSGRKYRLYLPLYTKVKWMEIGITDQSTFIPIKAEEKEGPIVIYGTSIVQGASATRPGMAWPSILGRLVDKEVVNLGFSGNGRLEPEIVEFIASKDASYILLDCMANFSPHRQLYPQDVKTRTRQAVEIIRKSHPETPIIIFEHAGYSDGDLNLTRYQLYTDLNKATQEIFDELQQEGQENLFLIKKEDLGLDIDSFVDGTHPNDYGMLQYAKVVAEKIGEIDKNK